jgi:fructose/tagatose bisphosphate aldolase
MPLLPLMPTPWNKCSPLSNGAKLDPADIDLTDPDEAEQFVNATGIDILAIALVP